MHINVLKNKIISFFVPLLILLALLINTRFTLWPEMMVYPYLFNNGFTLYKDLVNPYLPTFIYFISIFSLLFKYSIFSYQLLTWSFAVLILSSVYFISLKIHKNHLYAFISSMFFALTAIPFGINELWFDLIQTPFIIFSVYYFYKFINSDNSKYLEKSFLLFLVSFFIKQQSLWLLIFYLIALILIKKRWSIYVLFKQKVPLLMFIFISLLFCAIFIKLGTVKEFIFWTLIFPFSKASSMPGYISLPTIKQCLVVSSLFLFAIPFLFNRNNSEHQLFYAASAISLFAYPRFDYFHLIPTVAILSIVAPFNLKMFFKLNSALKLIYISSAIFLFSFCLNAYQQKWSKEIRFFEDHIKEEASIIKLTSNSSDRFYILNGPDQLLPLSGRLPVKPWADEFPWYLELKDTQQNIADALLKNPPKYVIYKPYENGGKYQLGSYKPLQISEFIDKNYRNDLRLSETLWLKTQRSFNKE